MVVHFRKFLFSYNKLLINIKFSKYFMYLLGTIFILLSLEAPDLKHQMEKANLSLTFPDVVIIKNNFIIIYPFLLEQKSNYTEILFLDNVSIKYRILDTDYDSYSVTWSCENKDGYNLRKQFKMLKN